jgi:hypothetical protein
MGVLRFRYLPADLASTFPDLRKAYVTGLDRTPGRMSVEIRPGQLIGHRESPESGRLHVPWPVEGFGTPILATATLAERAEPYDLAVELARGRLNDVRNQLADWTQVGLAAPPELDLLLSESQRAFAHAATSRSDPADAATAAQKSLVASCRAGEMLIEAYTVQVLAKRREDGARLGTALACQLDGDPKRSPWLAPLLEGITAARIRCPWGKLAPTEGRFRWDEPDAHLSWCRAAKLTPSAGPLLDLRPAALPDWLWLWEGDFDQIQGMVVDLVRQALARYKGKIGVWHLVARAGSGEILGLTEEEQIRLTAKAIQVARQTDPNAQLVIDFDRPWAEWMGSGSFQLGPLHLADSLARADLGMAGLGLEVAPGYGPPGSHIRDLFDFSRLLDLYALINLPLYVTLLLPSGDGPDANADPAVRVETAQWPTPPTEQLQRDWAAKWVALAVAKPFVRSVCWGQVGDSLPHVYPHAGLFRADQTPKPVVPWLREFRAEYLD